MSDVEKQIAGNLEVARLVAAEALPGLLERLHTKLLVEEGTESLIKGVKALKEIAEPRKEDKVNLLPTVNITIGLDGTVQAAKIADAVEVVEQVAAEPEALPPPAAPVVDFATLLEAATKC